MFFYISKIVTFLLDPLFWILAACLYGMLRPKGRRVLRVGVFIPFYLMSTPLVSHYLLSNLEHLKPPSELKPHYEAVVVLSGMVHLKISTPDRIEFAGSVDRILAGIDMARSGRADDLIISGGDGDLPQNGGSEALLLKEFAIRSGVASSRILVDPRSRNTHENAVETAAILKQHGQKDILLITSAFHMVRAAGCFKQVGLNVDLLPVDYQAKPMEVNLRSLLPSSVALSKTYLVIHESVGIIVYGLSGRAVYLDG